MTQQRDSQSELRAAFAMRELNSAKRGLSDGSIGVFMRVTLAIIFMYMVVISYQMLGTTGPALVSILFLAALFSPLFYQWFRNQQEKRKSQQERQTLSEESRQKG